MRASGPDSAVHTDYEAIKHLELWRIGLDWRSIIRAGMDAMETVSAAGRPPLRSSRLGTPVPPRLAGGPAP